MSILLHMKRCGSKPKQILELARKKGIVSASEIDALGIHHEHLRQMRLASQLVRVGRGLYSLPDANITAHHGLAQASKAIPKGVICLLSALRFHEIGTQAPSEVWMAIERGTASPQSKHPRTRIVRFSGKAFSEGVKMHAIEGLSVKVYSPAKTVADCFKYRNKIGLDVALESLREVLQTRKCTTDELWMYAKICRVTNVMRPYMEATV